MSNLDSQCLFWRTTSLHVWLPSLGSSCALGCIHEIPLYPCVPKVDLFHQYVWPIHLPILVVGSQCNHSSKGLSLPRLANLPTIWPKATIEMSSLLFLKRALVACYVKASELRSSKLVVLSLQSSVTPPIHKHPTYHRIEPTTPILLEPLLWYHLPCAHNMPENPTRLGTPNSPNTWGMRHCNILFQRLDQTEMYFVRNMPHSRCTHTLPWANYAKLRLRSLHINNYIVLYIAIYATKNMKPFINWPRCYDTNSLQ